MRNRVLILLGLALVTLAAFAYALRRAPHGHPAPPVAAGVAADYARLQASLSQPGLVLRLDVTPPPGGSAESMWVDGTSDVVRVQYTGGEDLTQIVTPSGWYSREGAASPVQRSQPPSCAGTSLVVAVVSECPTAPVQTYRFDGRGDPVAAEAMPEVSVGTANHVGREVLCLTAVRRQQPLKAAARVDTTRLYLDPDSGVPVARVTTSNVDGHESTVSQTYTAEVVDMARLPPRFFDASRLAPAAP